MLLAVLCGVPIGTRYGMRKRGKMRATERRAT
jgi:hypothetical protein